MQLFRKNGNGAALIENRIRSREIYDFLLKESPLACSLTRIVTSLEKDPKETHPIILLDHRGADLRLPSSKLPQQTSLV